VVHGISRQGAEGGTNDYYLASVSEPWPTNVGTMRLLMVTDYTNTLAAPAGLSAPEFFNSQFSRTEGSGSFRIPGAFTAVAITNTAFAGGAGIPVYVNDYALTVTNALGQARGGDSGSPTFIVVSNRLVRLLNRGLTGAYVGTMSVFLGDVNTATLAAGYTTNDFPIEFETLEGFPNL
jgi:hypothetical protein